MGTSGLEHRDLEKLIEEARAASRSAHAPYSGYFVGAALLAASGRVYLGCNVESAAYGATVCAERAALCAAVVAGERSFRGLAVYAEGPRPPVPCGICRQLLAEFGLDLEVVAVGTRGARYRATLVELLPAAFTADNLGASPPTRPAEESR